MRFRSVLGFSSIGFFSNFVFMVSTFLLIKSTNVDIMGSYFLFVTLSGLVANILLFGNGTSFNRDIIDDIRSSSVLSRPTVFFSLSIVALFFIFIISRYVEYGHFLIVIYFEAAILKVLRERFFCSYERARNRHSVYFFVQISYVFSRLILVYLFSLGFFDFYDLLLLQVSTAILMSVPVIKFLVENLKYTCFTSYKLYPRTGGLFFLSTLFTMGYDYTPVLILSMYSTPEQISFFSSNFKIVSVFIIGLGIVSQSLLPFYREKYNNFGKDYVVSLSGKILFALIVLYIPIFVFLYSYTEETIRVFLSESYSDTSNILKILLFSTFGSIGNFVLFPALQAINKVKYVANIVGPIAILNIILSFSLRELGAEGMAIALTSSMIVCSIITVFVLLRLKDKK